MVFQRLNMRKSWIVNDSREVKAVLAATMQLGVVNYQTTRSGNIRHDVYVSHFTTSSPRDNRSKMIFISVGLSHVPGIYTNFRQVHPDGSKVKTRHDTLPLDRTTAKTLCVHVYKALGSLDLDCAGDASCASPLRLHL